MAAIGQTGPATPRCSGCCRARSVSSRRPAAAPAGGTAAPAPALGAATVHTPRWPRTCRHPRGHTPPPSGRRRSRRPCCPRTDGPWLSQRGRRRWCHRIAAHPHQARAEVGAVPVAAAAARNGSAPRGSPPTLRSRRPPCPGSSGSYSPGGSPRVTRTRRCTPRQPSPARPAHGLTTEEERLSRRPRAPPRQRRPQGSARPGRRSPPRRRRARLEVPRARRSRRCCRRRRRCRPPAAGGRARSGRSRASSSWRPRTGHRWRASSRRRWTRGRTLSGCSSPASRAWPTRSAPPGSCAASASWR
mmetsp:Transcript_63515/g.178760  ORF Transcript_63515/g.178760 Transcript_63515/m.178760 type:complete len:302 (+) Transcript_63515:823-1728(+)